VVGHEIDVEVLAYELAHLVSLITRLASAPSIGKGA
jgi:hypothetical protein